MAGGGETRIIQPLYRALLRLAIAFDREPAAKLLIHARKKTGGGGDSDEKASPTLYQAALSEFLGSSQRCYLSPESEAKVADLVKRYFRLPLEPASAASLSKRIDDGFAAIRELSGHWHKALTHIISAKTKKRRRQQAAAGDFAIGGGGGGAAAAAAPGQIGHTKKGGEESDSRAPLTFAVTRAKSLSPGVLLLAHPMLGKEIFRRTVILLIEHHGQQQQAKGAGENGLKQQQQRGSYGLVLNKELDLDLHRAIKGGGMQSDFFKAFSDSPLRQGGPVARLQMLHRSEAVGGVALKQGEQEEVYVSGSVEKAVGLVLSGKAPPDSFHLFLGACTWCPGELEREIERGDWIIASAPPTISTVGYRPELWREVLQKLGAKYRHAASVPESVLA